MFGKIKHSNKYKTFENKSIAKDHQIQNKYTEYIIFNIPITSPAESKIRRTPKMFSIYCTRHCVAITKYCTFPYVPFHIVPYA